MLSNPGLKVFTRAAAIPSPAPPIPARQRQIAQQHYRGNDLDGAVNALGKLYPILKDEFCQRLVSFGRNVPETETATLPGWLVGLILKREFCVLPGMESRQYFSEHLLPGNAVIPEGKGWFFELKNAPDAADIPTLPELSRHMADTCLTLKAGRSRVYNPVTGAFSETALSLLPDLVLLRDTPENIFVSSAPRPFATNTFECTYIFPERRLILLLQGGSGSGVYTLIRDDLTKIANNYRNLADHARANACSGEIILADRPVNHLGHYVWNCLSAWETINETGLASRAKSLASWKEGDYFGNPLELIPTLAGSGQHTLRPGDTAEAVDYLRSHNSFWLPMYDRYIRRELAEKIISHCHAGASDTFIAQVNALQQGQGPVILLTIRTGNRAWIEQQEGYLNIIRELTLNFPGAAFILDGMNDTHGQSSTHRFMDTEAELELAQGIISDTVPSVPILNTIGMPIGDSIVACDIANAFIAPWGTAMTKYKWIANKPGVAFGGVAPEGRSAAGIGVRVFNRFRDDILPAVDVSPEHISDAGAGNLNEPLRRNFSMPWQVVRDAMVPLLQGLGFKRAQNQGEN